MKSEIQKLLDIDNTLNSLDGIRPVEISPFFVTRVQERLQSKEYNPSGRVMIYKPFWTITVLTIFFAINVFLLIRQQRQSRIPNNESIAIQSFASEYQLNATTNY